MSENPFTPLLGALTGATNAAYQAHWNARGRASYSDHLLFERIYKARRKELDAAAEIGMIYGSVPSDLQWFGQDALNFAEKVAFERSVHVGIEPDSAEMDALRQMILAELVVDQINDDLLPELKSGGTRFLLATENLLGGVAQANLETIYLLKQRLSSL